MSGSHFFFSSLFWEILSTYATEVNSWSRFHWRSLYQGGTDVLQIFRHWKLKSMWIGHACCEVSTINLSLSHDGSMALWQYWNRVHSLARVLHWTRCSQIQVALPKNDQLLLTSQPNICHNPAVIQLCMTRHACFSTRVKDFNNVKLSLRGIQSKTQHLMWTACLSAVTYKLENCHWEDESLCHKFVIMFWI